LTPFIQVENNVRQQKKIPVEHAEWLSIKPEGKKKDPVCLGLRF
jgi:hypothetical protein